MGLQTVILGWPQMTSSLMFLPRHSLCWHQCFFPKKVDLPQRCSNAWRHLWLSQHEEMLWEPESQRPEMLLNTCEAHETALQWDSLALLLNGADGDPQVQIHQAKQATPVHGGWGCSGWKGEFCHRLSSAAACSSHRGWHVLTHPEGSLNHWWPQKPHCASPVQTQWDTLRLQLFAFRSHLSCAYRYRKWETDKGDFAQKYVHSTWKEQVHP